MADVERPPNAVPYIRPTFSAYVDGHVEAPSLQEYRQRLPLGVPIPDSERLWAGVSVAATNTGTNAVVNALWNGVDLPAADNFSIYQMNVVDTGMVEPPMSDKDDEWLGVALGRNPFLMGTEGRVYFEYLTDGSEMKDIGDFRGGWAPGVQGYVTLMGTNYPPAVAINPATFSTVNGTQFDTWVHIVRDTNCPVSTACNAAWWVWINEEWAGYFPVGIGADMIPFDLINNQGRRASYYGEVHDASPAAWTTVDMGSGEFPLAAPTSSFGIAAYAKSTSTRRNGVWTGPTMEEFNFDMGDDPNCYGRAKVDHVGNIHLYFGGPGQIPSWWPVCIPF